jgi:hypothetical protein
MILSTLEVAVYCSSASYNSRFSSATSVSAPPPDEPLPAALGRLWLSDFDDLGRRDLAGLPLALVRHFIAYPPARTAVSRLAQR